MLEDRLHRAAVDRNTSIRAARHICPPSGHARQWIGETDLLTARTSGDSGVNKHYDLEDAAQLNVVLAELIGLITVPPDAFTYATP